MLLISCFPLLLLLFAILIQGILVRAIVTDTDTFDYTGSVQTWNVPFNVHTIQVLVKGASGGVSGTTAAVAGKGAKVTCDLSVDGVTAVKIYVGGKGKDAHDSNSNILNPGGWNGGGDGQGSGTGGGGASDIRMGGTYTLDDRKVVAGGGGGMSILERMAASLVSRGVHFLVDMKKVELVEELQLVEHMEIMPVTGPKETEEMVKCSAMIMILAEAAEDIMEVNIYSLLSLFSK
jgi:hypothetical protein